MITLHTGCLNVRCALHSSMIFHVTKRGDWLSQKSNDSFSPSDLQREGFVHCCTKEQLPGVLERYFKNQHDLIILHLEENWLTAPLKYEPSTNNENFPHVYGPINRSAVVEISGI